MTVWAGAILVLIALGLSLRIPSPPLGLARVTLTLAIGCFVIGAVAALGERATRNVTSLRAMIRQEAARLAQESAGMSGPAWLGIWRRTLVLAATPSWRSTVIAACIGMALWVAVLLLSGGEPFHKHEERLLTLWQVQAAFAGFALPFLLYIIEHAGQEVGLARRTSEVLIRQTFIFPVLALVITLTLLPALALQWFPRQYAHLAGTLGLVTTVIVVLYAYQQAISLLSDPSALREHSIQLLEERLEESIDQEVDRRLGAGILLSQVRELGAVLSYLPPNRHDRRFLVLFAPQAGTLVDVDIQELRRFIQALPPRPLAAPYSAHESAEPEEADFRPQGPPAILILKQYMQAIPVRDRALIALRRDAFGDLDGGVLERWVQAIFWVDPL